MEPEKDSEIFDSLIPTLVRPSSKPVISSHSVPIAPQEKASRDSTPKMAAKRELFTNSDHIKDECDYGGGAGCGVAVVKGSSPCLLPNHPPGGGECCSHARFKSVEIRVEPSQVSGEGPSSLRFNSSSRKKRKRVDEGACSSSTPDQPSLTIEQVLGKSL